MRMFTSDRERTLWLWTLAVVVAIYATLGLAGTLAGMLGARGLSVFTFVLGGILVIGAVAAAGLSKRSSDVEIFVVLGVAAVYVLVFTRLTSAVERSHLMEYGIVAVFMYAALTERARNGLHVPVPALLAILGAFVIGVVDELVQLLLPNRVFDPVDIVFNAVAAVMAVAGASMIVWARRRKSTSPTV